MSKTRIPKGTLFGIAIAPNRSVKLISLDNGHFDPDYSKTDHNRVANRHAMFERFLNEYDLIGMSKDDLLRLLRRGYSSRQKDNTYRYVLTSGCTWQTTLIIQMNNDNKVESWSMNDPWLERPKPDQYKIITTNVVIDPTTGETNPKKPRQWLSPVTLKSRA